MAVSQVDLTAALDSDLRSQGFLEPPGPESSIQHYAAWSLKKSLTKVVSEQYERYRSCSGGQVSRLPSGVRGLEAAVLRHENRDPFGYLQ